VVWPTLKPYAAEQVYAALRAQIIRGGDITAVQMARDLNLRAFIVANRIYGGFAHRMADALGSVRDQQWWPTLATCPGKDPRGHYIWRLRPTLREALRRFGPTRELFASRRSDPGFAPDKLFVTFVCNRIPSPLQSVSQQPLTSGSRKP
jgi:hypothetical protein